MIDKGLVTIPRSSVDRQIMRSLFGRSQRKNEDGQDTAVPEGARVVSVAVKGEYEIIPMHVYHPTPHDAITILRNKKETHRWFVAGWYLGLHRQGGHVRGLIYRPVVSDQDRAVVLAEVQKRDKEASVIFELEER